MSNQPNENPPPRLNHHTAAPEAMRAMIALEGAVMKSGLERSLLDLVKLRASLINGCAYCIDMHTREARSHGEDERRLHLVSVWHEAPAFYTARERAALAWTETVTLIATSRAPDAIYQQALKEFSEAELVNLTLAIVAINGWNRFAISFRMSPPAPAAA